MTAKRKKVTANPVVIHGCGGASWAIPRTAEAYDQMVEQMAKSLFRDNAKYAGEEEAWKWESNSNGFFYSSARSALRSIGITRPKETKK